VLYDLDCTGRVQIDLIAEIERLLADHKKRALSGRALAGLARHLRAPGRGAVCVISVEEIP
jgi:hypothetical protein